MLTVKEAQLLELLRDNHKRGLVFARASRLSPALCQIVPSLRAKGVLAPDRFVPIAAGAAGEQAPPATMCASKRKGWDEFRKETFVAAITRTASIAGAKQAVGLSANTNGPVSIARAADPAFAARCDAALEAARRGRRTDAAPSSQFQDLRPGRADEPGAPPNSTDAPVTASSGVAVVPAPEEVFVAPDEPDLPADRTMRPTGPALADEIVDFCDRVGTNTTEFCRFAGFSGPHDRVASIRLADRPLAKTVERVRDALARWDTRTGAAMRPLTPGVGSRPLNGAAEAEVMRTCRAPGRRRRPAVRAVIPGRSKITRSATGNASCSANPATG